MLSFESQPFPGISRIHPPKLSITGDILSWNQNKLWTSRKSSLMDVVQGNKIPTQSCHDGSGLLPRQVL